MIGSFAYVMNAEMEGRSFQYLYRIGNDSECQGNNMTVTCPKRVLVCLRSGLFSGCVHFISVIYCIL